MTALFTVTKTWQKPDGTPYVGAVVRFRAQNRLTDAQTGVNVPAGPNDQPNQLNITLDADGHMSHQFYAGWYTVKELFGNYDSYPVEITADGELPTPALPLPEPPSQYWTAAQTAAADQAILELAETYTDEHGGGGGGTETVAGVSPVSGDVPVAPLVTALETGGLASQTSVASKADASALATETSARQAADTAEAATRAAADTTNANALAAEASTARAAEAASEKTANKGAANGYAPLDGSSKVPAANLPSYVDDVLEFANLTAFPGTGSTGIIYVADDTNKTYRWGGSSYTEISPSPGSTDAVPEGSTNLYYTNARASAAAPVQSVAGRAGAVSLTKTDVGLANVDNTSDANKPVSTAQAAADAASVTTAETYADRYAGSAAGTASRPLAATDATTTNARTPTAHHTTHSTGGSDAIAPADIGAAPITTTTIDLVDRTNNTTETVPAGTTTNCSTAGVTKTAPALAGSVGTPPLRWAVKNLAAGSITVSYPDQAGATQTLTVLSGETRTFRQKSTSGWGVESGAIAVATLDARFPPLAGPFAPSSTGATAATRYVGGTTTGAPTSGTFAVGDFVVTQDGNVYICTSAGTPGTWVQGIGSGQLVAGPFRLTGSTDVKAVGTTSTDVSGSTLVIPATNRGIAIRFKFDVQMNTSTAASGSLLTVQVDLTDASNTILTTASYTGVATATASVVWRGNANIELLYDAPYAGGTVKLRYHTVSAVPANWGSALILPAFNGASGIANSFYAQAL